MSEPSKRVQLRRIAADGHVHKFEGLLAKPLEVGERLVLWYGERCKLTSTMIEKIIREHADELRVFTRKSEYIVSFLPAAA